MDRRPSSLRFANRSGSLEFLNPKPRASCMLGQRHRAQNGGPSNLGRLRPHRGRRRNRGRQRAEPPNRCRRSKPERIRPIRRKRYTLLIGLAITVGSNITVALAAHLINNSLLSDRRDPHRAGIEAKAAHSGSKIGESGESILTHMATYRMDFIWRSPNSTTGSRD